MAERAAEQPQDITGPTLPKQASLDYWRVWWQAHWKNALLVVLAITTLVFFTWWVVDRFRSDPEIATLQSQISVLKDQNAGLLQSVVNKDQVIASQSATISQLQGTGGVAASSIAAVAPPSISKMMTQTQAMTLLRRTFPEVAIRGPERTQYSLIPISELQRFLAADASNTLALGEDSDYVARFMGLLKQPGWDGVPVGLVKPTRTNPEYAIAVIEINGAETVVGVDIRTDRTWIIAEDKSADFLVILQ